MKFIVVAVGSLLMFTTSAKSSEQSCEKMGVNLDIAAKAFVEGYTSQKVVYFERMPDSEDGSITSRFFIQGKAVDFTVKAPGCNDIQIKMPDVKPMGGFFRK